MKSLIFLPILFVLSGCASRSIQVSPSMFTSSNCEMTFKKSHDLPIEEKLNKLSELYSQQCFAEVTQLGSAIREHSRDKFYQISAETIELVTPEGTMTEYVLESYERTYLSILIALSYLKQNQNNSALVELRRASLEQSAALYNFGEDRSLHLLLAALWDRFDPAYSRPHWKKVREMAGKNKHLLRLANLRIQEIDQNPDQKVLWQIEGLEFLPELTWSVNLFNVRNGPFDLDYKGAFPEICATEEVAVVPTTSWIEKLAYRHSPEYHPLLYTKSLTRFPVAIGYGIVGATTGIALGFGGCGLASQAGSGADELCEVSLRMGFSLAKESLNIMNYTMKPDLRHWRKMPKAIALARPDYSLEDQCVEGWMRHAKTIEFTSN